MKKIILIVVCSFIYITVQGQTLQRTILSHNGKITQYDANNWKKAISDAVSGDTVYFTSGTFVGELTINKPLTLIGPGVSKEDCFDSSTYGDFYASGASAKLTGQVTLSIAQSDTLHTLCFEGIYFNSAIYGCNLSKMIIRRCHINDLFSQSSYIVNNLVLESSYVSKFFPSVLASPNIYNCYISTMYNGGGVTFTNCTFVSGYYANSGENCTYVNCCLNMKPRYSAFVNCLYTSADSESTYTNCWKVSNPHKITAAQMLTSNYLGLDGTIVGPMGGPAPFTMKPSLPYIEESTVEYDVENKKLNVSMKVKRGE